jgi:hypothetical protein
VAAWKHGGGRRRAARLAMAMAMDARAGVPPEETRRRLAPRLRALTELQLAMVAQALADARRRRPPRWASPSGPPAPSTAG